MRNKTVRSRWDSYQVSSAFVLGFHGCDASVGEAILRGKIRHLSRSENDYDWLGSGIYFWENNPQCAFDFAQERAVGGRNSQGKIQKPFVIGAIINLGRCLDLRDSASLLEVKASYEGLLFATADQTVIPQNSGAGFKIRRLDCAVINFLHNEREERGWPQYDAVRADFWEGGELYPNAGFREQDHIQICVRNTASILGYFRPLEH